MAEYMTVVYQADSRQELKDYYKENIKELLFNEDEDVSVTFVAAEDATRDETF